MAHGNRVCGAASFTYNYDLHRRDTYGSYICQNAFCAQGESLFIRYGTYAETICYGGSSDSLYRILYVSHVRADDFGNISIHDSMGEGRRLCTALFYIF